MKNFFKGLLYNFKGIGFFIENKKLWKFVIIPFVINLLALALLITLYTLYFNDIFSFITKPLGSIDVLNPDNFWWHILDGLLWVSRFLLKIIFFLISFVLMFFIVFALSCLINAPFYELLSEEVLILKQTIQDRPFQIKTFFSELFHSLKIELYKLIIFTSLSLLILLLSSIPFIGPIFTFISFIFAAWVFAFGLCTYPMIIQKTPFKKMISWAKAHKACLIGFGIPSIIPVLGFLIIHFQVIGGTLLYINHKPTN